MYFFKTFSEFIFLEDSHACLSLIHHLTGSAYYFFWVMCCLWMPINTLRPRQNGHHFADNTFKLIFVNENVRILINISPKFVPRGPINNIPTLVQIMAWHRPGDKPLSEPIMVRLPTHICVTQPQWVNLTILLSLRYRSNCICNVLSSAYM